MTKILSKEQEQIRQAVLNQLCEQEAEKESKRMKDTLSPNEDKTLRAVIRYRYELKKQKPA